MSAVSSEATKCISANDPASETELPTSYFTGKGLEMPHACDSGGCPHDYLTYGRTSLADPAVASATLAKT